MILCNTCSFSRSTQSVVFSKITALKNFELIIVKYLCRSVFLNPHMHEIILLRYCMKWVPGDPLKEMLN